MWTYVFIALGSGFVCVPVTSPEFVCLTFERPKLKKSEFGVKKGLLIKKAQTEKMGALVVSQICLMKVQFRLLLGQGKEKERGNQ